MGFSLSLPPLVGLLLLAFLWLILFVLLVWFAFGRRRDPDEFTETIAETTTETVDEPRGKRPRKTGRTERDGLEAAPKPDTSKTRKPRASDQQTSVQRTPAQRTSVQPAPRPTVRAVTPTERPTEPTGPKTDAKADTKDAFDDFNQPDHRRDELDF